ncbi:MAG: hypothetical protein M1829_002419 [Trizodia sp. TS-e1964]|nr:MAG: hypothetical protein M1829_002419 [Trizodia sp. TS-e1964]
MLLTTASKRHQRKKTTTEAEYLELPHAVRRKYFSSLERLQLAQNSACSNSQPSHHQRQFSASSRLAHSSRSSSSSSRPAPRLLRKKQSVQGEYLLSQADAQWFLALPEKIQRRHFSIEEQLHIAARCETALLDAADEALHRLGKPSLRALTSVASHSLRHSFADSYRSSSMDMESLQTSCSFRDSFSWMDEQPDLDLRLAFDDYHAHIAPQALKSRTPSALQASKPLFRRNLSMSSKSFTHTSTSSQPSSPPPQLPPQLPLPDKNAARSRAISTSTSRHVTKKSISTLEPEATHYQDPEARLKLRVYLASPQKFDEAVEFGFPSAQATARELALVQRAKPDPRRLEIRRSNVSEPCSFFQEDGESLFDDADDSSLPDTDIPITPSAADTSFRPTHRLPSSNLGSTDSPAPFQPSLRQRAESYGQVPAGSREMTLRMTLTRPDLRADESLLYGWQGRHSKEDPLALDDLPDTPDNHGQQSNLNHNSSNIVPGPFGGVDGWGAPDRDGVMKKFWKRMKPKTTLHA